MTEEQKYLRVAELNRELRELEGARAIVWVTAEDILTYTNDEAYGKNHGKVTLEQAQAWLNGNEEELREWMEHRAWDYITRYAHTISREEEEEDEA